MEIFAKADKFLASLRERLIATSVGRRLANGAVWSLVASVASRSLALFTSIIAARLLGSSDFGGLGIVQSTIDMFGTLAGFGMGLTATKYVAECRERDPERAGRIIAMSSVVAWIMGCVIALVLYFYAPWLAANAVASPRLAPLLQISAISLLLSAVAGVQLGTLSGFEAFKDIARINLISGILLLCLRTAGTLIWGLEGAVLGLTLSQAAIWWVNHDALKRVALRSGIQVRFRGCLAEMPVLWKFSLPSVLGSIIGPPAAWACNAMLVRQPNGYAEMGILNATNQWFYFILFVPNLMGQASLPVLFERISQGNHGESRALFKTLLKINGVVILPVLALAPFSHFIMSLYGADFAAGWPTMLLCLLTAGVMAVQMPGGYMLVARGKMWEALVMNLAWGLSLVSLNAGLVHLGSTGVALARLLAAILHLGWTFAYVFIVLQGVGKPAEVGVCATGKA
jgi:O-antigen/teichoic acid export membrane protein